MLNACAMQHRLTYRVSEAEEGDIDAEYASPSTPHTPQPGKRAHANSERSEESVPHAVGGLVFEFLVSFNRVNDSTLQTNPFLDDLKLFGMASSFKLVVGTLC